MDMIKKAMSALIVGVAPAGIAGVQEPWMALSFHILVTWIRLRGLTAPAIHAGMTVLIYFQRLTRPVPLKTALLGDLISVAMGDELSFT
jgi:hypothetical protein